MSLPFKTSDGVLLEMSDQHTDLFIRGLVALKATHSDGVTTVYWELPKRLLARFDAAQIVADEILAELEERATAKGQPS